MSTIIYYFSGTGNSFKIAEDLSKKIGTAKVIAVANAQSTDITAETTAIGIVFPILMFGLPLFVKDFITKNSAALQAHYAFYVASNGGNIAGSFLQIQKALHRQLGNASFHSFIVSRKDFSKENWDQRIGEIAGAVTLRKAIPFDKVTFMNKFLLTGVINKLGNRFMDVNFSVSDACTGCEICRKICPADNIAIVQGKPRWSNKCNRCFGCVNWCPANAISAKSAASFMYRSPLVQSSKELFIR